MDSKTKEEILKLLADNLELVVKKTSVYTGGMDGGDMYRDSRTIQLYLNGEVISEVWID